MIFRASRQWQVRPHGFARMLPSPTCAAEIFETFDAAAKVGALLDAASRTRRVLQVRVDLDLKNYQ